MAIEPDDRTLYIGNIDKDVNEEILYELFLQAGPIDRVSIPSGRNDTFRYGFVTYKHDCSVEYAIELFKGTQLYKRELNIKKKGAKSNCNSQQGNDFNKHCNPDLTHARQNFQDNPQDSLMCLDQFLMQNNKHHSNSMVKFTSISIKGNWSGRNKPYSYGVRNNYAPRQREPRDRCKDRDYGNKLYHGRKNRRRN